MIRGQGYTAWEKPDHYFVLLDGPLSTEDRDRMASKVVAELDELESEDSSFGRFLADTQDSMRRGAYGGLNL